MSELVAKAIVFEEIGQATVQEIELPAPTADDIVVQTHVSGVSVGTERWAYIGKRTEISFPNVPGYMGIGEVTQAGETAAALGYAPGQMVNFFHSRMAPPYDRSWMAAHLSRAVVNVNYQFAPGDFDVHGCQRLPEGCPPLGASLTGLCAVALRGIEMAVIPVGAKVLVSGVGVIGQCAAQVARLKGAEVCIADVDQMRLDIAARLGAHCAVNPATQDLAGAAAEIAPNGFDIIIDTSSKPEVCNGLFPLLKPWGKFVFQGWYPPPSSLNVWAMQRPATCYFPSAHNDEAVAAAMRWVAEGKLDIESLITHIASPTEAPEMYRMIEQNTEQFLGVVFDWR
jgi:3-hydroxyethyl bacteriochlorophyllide a dehydrogenase